MSKNFYRNNDNNFTFEVLYTIGACSLRNDRTTLAEAHAYKAQSQERGVTLYVCEC